MRNLLACFILAAGLGAPAAAQMRPTLATLVSPCEAVDKDGCTVRLSIDGAITAETAASFFAVLDQEQKRARVPVRPVVTIQSTGGDLMAAMTVGREIRKRTGAVMSPGPCHSACVFIAMGGVERNLAGIGLHRPYFGASNTSVYAEADARYKNMLRLIADYLFEMNVPDDLLRRMVAVPPGEMRVLPAIDAHRIGLNGVDPAWDELNTGKEAALYGVNSAELRRRKAALDNQCGREETMRSLEDLHRRDHCQKTLREPYLWGLDETSYARLLRISDDRCKTSSHGSPERKACMREVAETLRPAAKP